VDAGDKVVLVGVGGGGGGGGGDVWLVGNETTDCSR